MNDLMYMALDKVDLGVILINSDKNIAFWNKYIEMISGKDSQNTLNKKLKEIITVFDKNFYENALEAVLVNNQSRFFSSKMHKAFIFPATAKQDEVRQNMKIEPLVIDENVYALIQIDDVTHEIKKERKLKSFINELKKDYAEIKQAEEISKALAVTDSLTGLLNRYSITKHLNQVISYQMDLAGYSLLFLDLDGFKSVNDTFGHNAGDAVLIKTAQRLQENTRKEDVIARLGGDEFVLLLKASHKGHLSMIAQKIIDQVAKPIEIEGQPICVTASIGICVLNSSISSPAEIINRADNAMYEAKKQGKNQFIFFDGQ